MLDKIHEIVKKELGHDVSDEFGLRNILDSLGVVKIVQGVEYEFGIEIENKEIESLRCIRDLAELVERKKSGRTDPQSSLSSE